MNKKLGETKRLVEAERLVRRLRQRIFDYYDESFEKGEKASRILEKALKRVKKYTPPPSTDRWGATAEDRRMLYGHGLTWGD